MLVVNSAGPPPEKSSGLATSISTLPSRLSAPAAVRASSDAAPDVQLKTSSPCVAASANSTLPSPAVREPTRTSWPSSASLPEIARPTIPVPSTPILIASSFCLLFTCRWRALPRPPARLWA